MPPTSDPRDACAAFESWLLTAGATERAADPAWTPHLETCDACRGQWRAHRALIAAFAAEPDPRLSPTFRVQVPVDRRPAPAPRRLAGWRALAMWTYAVAALAILRWALRDVALPAIDPASPWVLVAALVAVPVTLALALVASAWLPRRRLSGNPTAPAI